MKVVLFGGTGMVGQGVLRECLRDSAVEEVQSVVRTACGQQHPKLKETVVKDLFELCVKNRPLSGKQSSELLRQTGAVFGIHCNDLYCHPAPFLHATNNRPCTHLADGHIQ
jgi:hypothetical protein